MYVVATRSFCYKDAVADECTLGRFFRLLRNIGAQSTTQASGRTAGLTASERGTSSASPTLTASKFAAFVSESSNQPRI